MTSQTLGREFISDGWKIGGRRQPLCMGIVWVVISSEKKIFVYEQDKNPLLEDGSHN
jgi:hypothetical protein